MKDFRQTLRGHVDPQTPFLDCSNQHIALSMLPRIPQAGFLYLNFPILRTDDAAACLFWISEPPSPRALIAVDRRRMLRAGRSRDSEKVLLSAVLEDSGAWAVRLSEGSVEVWEQTSDGAAASP